MGGNLVWDLDDEYGNGSVTRWSLPNSILWGRFDRFLSANVKPEAVWWHLCTAQTENTTMDLAMIVLERLRERLPDTPLWISAQPDYVGGHDCGISGAIGPELMVELAAELVAMGIGQPGPAQGPLRMSETTDGCHANEAGRAILGGQLADFLKALDP
jgi:hypothetical protein